jgi:dihydroorotase
MLDALQPGDVVTHLYHPKPDSPFEGDVRAPSEALRRARDRGVLFDVGHGVGSFAWSTAEPACLVHGFWPDSIGTDVHAYNLHGPVHDMPTTMSKFLHLGMPLPELIRASTQRPAEVIGKEGQLGSLREGLQADITLLRLEEGPTILFDVQGEGRTATERLIPVSVFKRGVQHPCQPATITAPSPETWMA